MGAAAKTHLRDTCAIVGAGKSRLGVSSLGQRPREHGPEFGHFGAVSQYAFGTRRHMHECGTTREDFAAVASPGRA